MNSNILSNLVAIAFPNGSISHERWSEVNGLSEDAVPEFTSNPRIEVVAIGNRYSEFTKNQTYFVARLDSDYYIFGRICDAMEGSTYAKYAVIHELDVYNEDSVKYCARKIETLTQ